MPLDSRPDGESLSWRTACGPWRCALDLTPCSSPASWGLRAPRTSPLFWSQTSGEYAHRALRSPSCRCDGQSGADAVPRPLHADFCAVDTGATGRGTWNAAPGAPRPTRRPAWGSRSFGAKNNDLLQAFVFISLFERFFWLRWGIRGQAAKVW